MEGPVSEWKTKSQRRMVGLLYDERMCKHHTPDDDYHPENPNRIRAIWNKLESAGIHERCFLLEAKEAEDKHILGVHSKKHVDLIKNISSKQYESKRDRIACKYNSIYFNEGSSEAAYLAAGSVVEVAKGKLDSAVAIVRPPGHHAEQHEAMELGIKRILIVDWDVHHGNGTQKMFYEDPRVLFFSVHRHEFGLFYPANDDGFYTMVGEGPGAGYNINVPWENGKCGDADYLAVWDHILVPVAKKFNPDIVIVSAGFDAAIGDPLGGCCVTPYGYSVMLKKLMDFANGKIVLALEGGYNLDSIANSMLACVKVLLEDNPINGSTKTYPFESTWRVIQAVRKELRYFWPTLAHELPKELINQIAPTIPVASSTFFNHRYVDTSKVSSPAQGLLTRSDDSTLKGMTVEEIYLDSVQCSFKLAQNNLYCYEAYLSLRKAYNEKVQAFDSLNEQNRLIEADNKALKVATTKAKMELMEQKWSKANHKLREVEKELTALRLAYAQAVAERDELRDRMACWRQKKKNVYRKGVMDAYLKAQNDMIRKFKAGKTDWPTPEPSEEEDSYSASEEISSGDD